MNLASIPEQVWKELAYFTLAQHITKDNVEQYLGDFFYEHIYSKYGEDVEYTRNCELIDDGWDDLISIWSEVSDSGKLIGDVINLNDHSLGRAGVQIDDGNVTMARPWEIYTNQNSLGDRFQFVVNGGGGTVLFNRMRRACQPYVIAATKAKTPILIYGWKVFGEEASIGRSDSCVVYLACSMVDPRLRKLITDHIWPCVSDLVDPDFKPIGFFSIENKPLFAFRIPEQHREENVLGKSAHGSAGGLMANVFGRAFKNAFETSAGDVTGMIAAAKREAGSICTQLYPSAVV